MVIPRKICGYSKDHLLSSSDYGLVLSLNLVLNFCLRPYTLVSAGGAHHLYVSALARPPAGLFDVRAGRSGRDLAKRHSQKRIYGTRAGLTGKRQPPAHERGRDPG